MKITKMTIMKIPCTKMTVTNDKFDKTVAHASNFLLIDFLWLFKACDNYECNAGVCVYEDGSAKCNCPGGVYGDSCEVTAGIN